MHELLPFAVRSISLLICAFASSRLTRLCPHARSDDRLSVERLRHQQQQLDACTFSPNVPSRQAMNRALAALAGLSLWHSSQPIKLFENCQIISTCRAS